MKQVVQSYKTGEVSLLGVPPPRLRAGGVLVQNVCSLISAGTERGMIELARKSLLEKARARPDLVRKVLDKARTEGLLPTYQKARQRLAAPLPLGYSSAGIVLAVGEGVADLEGGDPVACGGIGYASHAEVIFVPRNLCVKIPEKAGSWQETAALEPLPARPGPRVPFAEAAYTTLGAIALEGVRVADTRLGEAVVVLGLGLIGLLTAQLLKAGGCRVVGLDLDLGRCQLAKELGCDLTGEPAQARDLVRRLTGGYGVDAVLIAAATPSSEPVHLAGELARDRGRVVILGNVGLQVPYQLYYEKALDLRLSRSYGPGRYDRFYEEKGLEYPLAYVRWTENRNMQSFLQLVAEGKVNVRRLTTHRFPFDQALKAYELITRGRQPHIGVLLEYEKTASLASLVPLASRVQETRPSRQGLKDQELGVGFIGAGNFTTGVLLQAIRQIAGVRLQGICSQGGLSARTAGDRFGFAYCTSSPEDLFNDSAVEAVLVTTRPRSHAELVVAALERGKHVFVEKPLAVNPEQLQRIMEACRQTPSSVLMVGYNRRFSPLARKLQDFLGEGCTPLAACYRVNAGALPRGDWQHDLEEGGGRIIGEAGHFIDLLTFLIGSPPERVGAQAVGGYADSVFRPENVILSLRFADGSIGTILYVTEGAARFPKERLEVFGRGAVGVIDDFRRLELVKGGKTRVQRRWLSQDKGHRDELAAFVQAVRQGGPAPVVLEDYLLTSLCTFQAVKSLQTGLPQPVSLTLLT